MSVCTFKEVIAYLYNGCDVQHDTEDIHPPFVCWKCQCALKRVQEKVKKGQAVNTMLSDKLQDFVPHGDSCNICMPKKPGRPIKKHPGLRVKSEVFMEDVPFTCKLYPCTPERSTTEPCVPERSTTEPCVPERSTTEPCVSERSTTEPCVPERCKTEPCVPERSTTEPCVPEQSTTESCVPNRCKTEPCVSEQSTTEPCVPERSTTESCVPERCKTEPCVSERSTTEPCVPERSTTESCVPERYKTEPCVPERSTTLYNVFGMAEQSEAKQGNKTELPQTKEPTLTQQPQRKEPTLTQQPQKKEPTLTQQLETMEVSLTQQSQTMGPYTTEQPQTNELTVTQCQTMEVILTPQPQTNHTEMQTVMPNIASKKTCLFCQKVITCRNYRSIFSEAVVEVHPQIQQIFNLWPDNEVWTQKGLSNIVCQPCFGKLKKLVKIDEELSTILQRLQEEKQSLIRILQSNAKIPTSLEDTPAHTTPTEPKSGGVKRKGREKTEIPPKVIKRHLAKYVPIAPAGLPSEMEKRHLAKYVLIAPAPGPDKNLAPTTRLTSDSFIPLKNEQDNLIQDSTGLLMDTVDTAKVIATDLSVQKWVVQDAGDSQYLKALNGDTSTEPGAASQNLMNIKCKEEPL